MNISSESHLAATVLCITGNLTVDDSDRFQRDIRETVVNFSTNVIIDCAGLDLIDSVGLESLLWLSDELNRNGKKLKYAAVPEPVQCVFELTRLDRVFSTHKTVEAAARSFA
ncbi:MAG: STAS domain-containing protein [Phycisphaerales bacterium]|jgi:anti-sigma B factor antagonist|nr:STAS domain-containing protein [Phycisphaerales bacterium]